MSKIRRKGDKNESRPFVKNDSKSDFKQTLFVKQPYSLLAPKWSDAKITSENQLNSWIVYDI